MTQSEGVRYHPFASVIAQICFEEFFTHSTHWPECLVGSRAANRCIIPCTTSEWAEAMSVLSHGSFSTSYRQGVFSLHVMFVEGQAFTLG